MTWHGSASNGSVHYSLIKTARLNDRNPQRFLADGLARIADHPTRHIKPQIRCPELGDCRPFKTWVRTDARGCRAMPRPPARSTTC
jgi:hypothetical protein